MPVIFGFQISYKFFIHFFFKLAYYLNLKQLDLLDFTFLSLIKQPQILSNPRAIHHHEQGQPKV
jgi:hypothetical protein